MMPPVEQVTQEGAYFQYVAALRLTSFKFRLRFAVRCSRYWSDLFFHRSFTSTKRHSFWLIGHFYFTKLLLPILLSTAKTSGPVRVVNVASTGMMMTGGLKFETFKDGPARKALGKQALYIQSKFGIIVVAQELARRYGNQGIVTTSLNPGTLESPLYRHVDSPVQKFVAVRLRV